MNADFLALADRVEAAVGSDPVLSREVLLACGKGYVSPLYRWLDPLQSTDAAMMLVPEGHGWRLWMPASSQVGDDDRPRVTVWGSAQTYMSHDTEAATPAQALTAAALRARAAIEGAPS